MFWFSKRKPAPESQPLQIFDRALDAFEKKGVEVRQAAATLLALRADLTRQVERRTAQLRALQARVFQAESARDRSATQTLQRDEAQERRLLQAAEEGLVRTETDGNLLIQAAQELRQQADDLRAERTAAEARLRTGAAQIAVGELTASLRWAHAVELDEARDEVERAHALAEIYRTSVQTRDVG